MNELTLESMVYREYYNRYGLRRSSEVLNPKLNSIMDLYLPRFSVYHHLDIDGVSVGPDPGDLFLKKHTGRHLIEHVTELKTIVGRHRDAKGRPELTIPREYRTKYRTLRPLSNFERSATNAQTQINFNYSILPKLKIYPTTRYSDYELWYNVYNTFFEEINAKANIAGDHHYIRVNLPMRVPSRKLFNLGRVNYKSMNLNVLSIYSKPEYMLLNEIFKWMGEDRKSSLMDKLEDSILDKINIVIVDGAKWTLFNLGRWQITVGDDAVEDDDVYKGSAQMQGSFIRYLNACVDARTSATEQPTKEKEKDNIEEDEEDDGLEKLEDVDAPDEGVEEPSVDEDDDEDDVDPDKEAKELAEISELIEDINDADHYIVNKTHHSDDPKEYIKTKLDAYAESGVITAKEYKRFERLIDNATEINNPFGEGTLGEFAKIPDEDKVVSDEEVKIAKNVDGLTDESFKEAKGQVVYEKYIDKVLKRHISDTILHFQKGDVVVQGVKSETISTISGDHIQLSIQVQPIGGSVSTVKARFPVIDKNGTFLANGIKSRMKIQRRDVPIRKTGPRTVALTSYYAKAFVERSERMVVNYPKWLYKQLSIIETDTDRMKNVKRVDVFNHLVDTPRIHSILSKVYNTFVLDNKYTFNLNVNKLEDIYDKKFVANANKDGYQLVGHVGKGANMHPLVVDKENIFYIKKDKDIEILGDVDAVFGIDNSKAPVEIAELSMFSKNIPLAFILGYSLGLMQLIKRLNAAYRRVPKGGQLNLEPNEYTVRFSDETLVFRKDQYKAAMILGGYNRYHREISKYPVDSFNSSDVYVNILEDNKIRVGFIREIELAMDMFVDPMTRDLLLEMNEPTNLEDLLFRSVELLLTDWHPKENSRKYMRDVGYERIAGALYGELVKSVRRYRSRGVGSDSKIEMNPEALWMSILTDAATIQVEDSNPIRNLKEKEFVTFGGSGGRSNQSMVKRVRSFTDDDLGITSDGGVDSGNVGINVSLTPNANINSLSGIAGNDKLDKTNTASMVSTTTLLSPAIDHDDQKRVVFAGVQADHAVAIEGGEPSPFSTSYEKVIAHRVDDLYATKATKKGKVIEVDEDSHIYVEYTDGEILKAPLGKKYGTVTGTTVPHELVTDFKVGDVVKPDTIITYNKGFFKRDTLDKGQVNWLGGTIAKIALMERPNTFEDACEISPVFSKKLVTSLSHIRDVRVNFKDVIHDLVKIGDELESDSTICIIEDYVAASRGDFGDDAKKIMETLNRSAPKADGRGIVEKIEVLYHGDIDDMSTSLKKITMASDRNLKKERKALGKPAVTGRVDASMRIGRDSLPLDGAVIRVYMTTKLGAGEGDKGVVANQLKTVFSHVMSPTNRTIDNEPLDMIFGNLSIQNRMVDSAYIMGTTISLLKHMSKLVYQFYNEER